MLQLCKMNPQLNDFLFDLFAKIMYHIFCM